MIPKPEHENTLKYPEFTGQLIPVGLLLLFILLLSINISSSTRLQTDENIYIQAVMEMLNSGNFFIPVFEGETRFQKPILFYWCMLVCYKLFGISLTAARLSSITAAALTGIVIFVFVKRTFSGYMALPSALLVLGSYIFFLCGRAAQTDATLNFFVCLSLAAFGMGYFETRIRKPSLFIAVISAGLAFSVKGGVALCLTILPMILFCLLNRDAKYLFRIFHPVNLLIFLVFALWHYVYMYFCFRDDFFYHLLYKEVSSRLEWSVSMVALRLMFYTFEFLINTAPFSVLPFILIFISGKLAPLPINRFTEKNLFLVVIILSISAFFIIFVSLQAQRYILPAQTFFSVLIVVTYYRCMAVSQVSTIINWVLVILVSIMLVLASVTALLLLKSDLITLTLFIGAGFLIVLAFICIAWWRKNPALFPLVILCSMLIMVYGETIIRPNLQIEREKELLEGFDFRDKDVNYFKIQKGSRALINLQARTTLPQTDLEGLFYLINRQVKRPGKDTWVIMPRSDFEKFPPTISKYLRLHKNAYRYSIESIPQAWFSLLNTEKLKNLVEESRDWISLVQILPYKPAKTPGR